MLVDLGVSPWLVLDVLEGGKVGRWEGVGIENILFIDSRCPQSQPAGGGRQQSSDWSSWAEGEENKAHQSDRYRHHYTSLQHSDSILTQAPASLASPQADTDIQGLGLLPHLPSWRSLISTPEILPSVSLPVFPLNKSLRTFLCAGDQVTQHHHYLSTCPPLSLCKPGLGVCLKNADFNERHEYYICVRWIRTRIYIRDLLFSH